MMVGLTAMFLQRLAKAVVTEVRLFRLIGREVTKVETNAASYLVDHYTNIQHDFARDLVQRKREEEQDASASH